MSADLFGMATTLAVLKYLAETQIAGQRAVVSDEALKAMPATTRLPVMLGGELIASVSVPNPSKRCKVTNAAKFLAWVQENRPDEVEDIPTIRTSYADAVKRSVAEHGGLLDKESGVVTPVPGLEAYTGDPYIRIELEDGAGAAIGRAHRDGGLDLSTMLALPAGETDAA